MVKNFYVINENNGKFEPYDIVPYLLEEFKKAKVKPKTLNEFKEFIKRESMHMWWARCEYEIIISDWPGERKKEKWDIHKQVLMNIDIITEILMKNVKIGK